MNRRRRFLLLLLPLVLVGMVAVFTDAGAYEGTSLYDNISPPDQTTSSLIERYPLVNYGLDWHSGDAVTTTDLGIFDAPTGVDTDAAGAGMMHRLANNIWSTTRFFSSIVISLFTFAFSLDIIGGANGALATVSQAVTDLYSAIGTTWMTLAVALLGAWATIHALLLRQYTRTFSQIALSMLLVTAALAIITQPLWAIGGLSRVSNEIANGMLGAVNGESNDNAKTAAADALFETLIYDPWVVLTFGGLHHCVNADYEPVKPGTRACKTLINHEKKYAERWLKAGAPNSKARNLEYKAIADGKTPTADEIDDADVPAGTFEGYETGDADKPAVDIQQKDIADDRAGMAAIVFVGQLGAWLLIGGLSIGVILAQVIALLLFAFAPLMLLAALFPGTGHRAFMSWGEKLFFAITRKIWYALILAVVLLLANALSHATTELGWLYAFGLQATFFWVVFLYRKQAYTMLNRAVGGHGGDADGPGLGQRAMKAYYMSKMLSPVTRALGGAATAAAGAAASGTSKAGKGAARGAKGAAAAAHTTGVNASGSEGHTGRMIDAARAGGQAYDELESEHAANVVRLSAETARRARVSDLQRRQQVATEGSVPDSESLNLTPPEQSELRDLQARRMEQPAYEGLRDNVREVERRAADSDGVKFTEAQVNERAAQIREREQEADYSRRTTTSNGRDTSRRDHDDMRDLAERARRYRDVDHGKLFPDPTDEPEQRPEKKPSRKFQRESERLVRRRRERQSKGD